VKTAWS